MRTLQNLKQLGVRLALDDFGTGYSSLNHLRRLPVDIIKIAKPFVDDLHGAEDSTAFAQSIVNLGHILGLEVMAEGIEQADQLGLVRWIDCEVGQGFIFSKALDAPAFEVWMRDWLASNSRGDIAA